MPNIQEASSEDVHHPPQQAAVWVFSRIILAQFHVQRRRAIKNIYRLYLPCHRISIYLTSWRQRLQTFAMDRDTNSTGALRLIPPTIIDSKAVIHIQVGKYSSAFVATCWLEMELTANRIRLREILAFCHFEGSSIRNQNVYECLRVTSCNRTCSLNGANRGGKI